MASPGWFNDNESRAYPFVTGGTNPPHALVVDAGFVAGAESRFASGSDGVKLVAVRRRGTAFYLEFTSDAPELFGVPLTFTRFTSDGDFVTELVDSGQAGLSYSSLSASTSFGSCAEPLWWGFVTTGRIAAFEALLPGDGDVTFDAAVEPGLVQNLAGGYVVKLAAANDDRTRVTPAAGCGDGVAASEVPIVNAPCVTGDVVFRAGYNAVVRQNAAENSITLGAAVGAGAGEPCGPVPLYSGELPPAGSNLLGGGPQCNETIRSVNGVGGPHLTVLAGAGVTVTPSPGEHKVTIDVGAGGLGACLDQVSHRSESC